MSMNMTAGSKGILMGCVAGALTVLGQPAWPAIVTWTGGNGHWADIGAPGWDSAEPDATDDAYVNTGATVTIDQSGERAKNLTLAVAATDSGTLAISGTWESVVPSSNPMDSHSVS